VGRDGEPRVLHLTTTGRVSGQPREIEIWFVASEDKLYLLAEHYQEAHWVRNIERHPRVRVRLGGCQSAATARVLDAGRDAAMWRLAQQLARENMAGAMACRSRSRRTSRWWGGLQPAGDCSPRPVSR